MMDHAIKRKQTEWEQNNTARCTYFVGLVSHEHFDDGLGCGVSVEFVEPAFDMVKRRAVRDIVH